MGPAFAGTTRAGLVGFVSPKCATLACRVPGERSTSRAFTPVFAGYGGALQTRDRQGLWRSRVTDAIARPQGGLRPASTGSGTACPRLSRHFLTRRIPARALLAPDAVLALFTFLTPPSSS